MRKLDLDYLDLFLIHWPNPLAFRKNWQEANAGTWKAFEELYTSGRIRSIGISNFRPHHVEELIKTAKIAPMVNQIRLCPGDTQEKVVDYCRSKNMLLEAYSPLGVGQIFEVPEMMSSGRKIWEIHRSDLHSLESAERIPTPAQICHTLSYQGKHGCLRF